MNATPILQLYNSLKPTIFNSQVVFYNLLFNFSRDFDEHFFSCMTINIKLLLTTHNHNQFMNNPITRTYYKKLLNTSEDVDSLSIKSNTINCDTLRSDINANMHKKNEKAIPKYWRQTFLTDNKRSRYKETLYTVFVYFMFMYNFDKIDLNNSTDINNVVLLPEHQKTLTQKISNSIAPIENLKTIMQLTDIIINQLYVQCEHKPISSLQNQLDFYMSHIECYGDRSIDKLYALEKYSSQNVYCAYALADIYYYGSVFYAGQKENAIEIQKDYIKAASYYKLCTHEPNLILPACWSLGYMYQNGHINSNSDNLKEAIRLFKKCGNYAPALSNLGQIEKEAGDKILFSRESFNHLDIKEKKACIKHYLSFIELNYSACCNDWVYAFNKLYAFYYKPQYSEIRSILQKEKAYLNLEPIYLLQ